MSRKHLVKTAAPCKSADDVRTAITNGYPEGRSVLRWLKHGWFVPIGYVVGFFVMLLLTGWDPSIDRPGAVAAPPPHS